MNEKRFTEPEGQDTGSSPPMQEAEVTNPAGGSPVGIGLEPNVAGALSYLIGALTGILFLVIDGKRAFVRFHAMQAITITIAMVILSVVLGVVSTVLAVVPILGWIVAILLSLGFSGAALVLWLYLMYRAWQGDEWEVPVAGAWARRLANQTVKTGGSHG